MDSNSKNIALASYITPVGWIIALITKSICDCSTPFALFHLKQGLGLNLIIIVGHAFFSILGIYILAQLFNLLVIIVIVYFVLQANSGNMTLIPYLGKYFDQKFTFIN